MAIGPRLDLRTAPGLVMTARMQQSVRLLAVPNVELESFIAEALAANPLLEIADHPPDPREPVADDRDTGSEDWEPVGEAGDGPPETPPERFDELGRLSGSQAEGGFEGAAAAPTLAEHLHARVGLAKAQPTLVAAAHWLIDQLDDDGYLRVGLNEAGILIGLQSEEVENALRLVQSLDPAGVGARDLSECLALQARDADRYDPCMARLIDRLDLLGQGKLAQLKRICGVDDEDFTDMLRELRGYDPKPGLQFGGERPVSIVPDLLVRQAGSGWDVALNPATLPRLAVNRAYYLELRGTCSDRQGRGWLGEKLSEGNWLVKALEQRHETLLKVGREIVRRQEAFFRSGVAQLRPLTLRTVADAIGLHESTVSRAASNKYLQCPRGTFELKFFFTSGVSAAGDEGEVSAAAVKAAIRELVAAEKRGAVLSDEALVAALRERGYELARRTVAKYREESGIPSSVERRRRQVLVDVR